MTADELNFASNFGEFDEKQKANIGCLEAHVKNSPVDVDFQGKSESMLPTLDNWNSLESALKQISKEDFKKIDANGDNVLQSAELKGSKGNKDLSKMSAHAASILSDHLDAAMSDPLISVQDGIKDWHTDAKSAEKADAQNSEKQSVVKGIDMNLSTMNVSKVDAQGRPEVIEGAMGSFKLSYDEQNRLTEMKDASGDGSHKIIKYDDENRSRSVISMGSDGSIAESAVSQFDENGRMQSEFYHNADGSTSLSRFDVSGRMVSQSTKCEDGRNESTIRYSGDEKSSSTTTRFDENGVKITESNFDHESKIGSFTTFDSEGNPSKIVEGDYSKSEIPSLTEKNFDADGNVKSSSEISFSDRPFLVGNVVNRDADGNVTESAKANWRNHVPTGILDSIEVKTPDGETKTLNRNSKGEDLRTFRRLESNILRNSRYPNTRSDVDTESPSKRMLDVLSAQPC